MVDDRPICCFRGDTIHWRDYDGREHQVTTATTYVHPTIAEIRAELDALPDITEADYSKAKCKMLHQALMHISFLLAQVEDAPQSKKKMEGSPE